MKLGSNTFYDVVHNVQTQTYVHRHCRRPGWQASKASVRNLDSIFHTGHHRCCVDNGRRDEVDCEDQSDHSCQRDRCTHIDRQLICPWCCNSTTHRRRDKHIDTQTDRQTHQPLTSTLAVRSKTVIRRRHYFSANRCIFSSWRSYNIQSWEFKAHHTVLNSFPPRTSVSKLYLFTYLLTHLLITRL